jgi:ABC-type amino acid transport substrate-binding protein
MKINFLYSSLLVIFFFFFVPKVLSVSNPPKQKIIYGFVTTAEALAKPDGTTNEPKYPIGYCVEFLETLKNDDTLKNKYSFISHAIVNQGSETKSFRQGEFDGIINGKLNVYCGALFPKRINPKNQKVVLSNKSFYDSEVKLLMNKDLLNIPSSVNNLSDLAIIFKRKTFVIGALKGHPGIKDVLINNGFEEKDIEPYDQYKDLKTAFSNGKIHAVAFDTLHMDSYLSKSQLKSDINKKYIILPPSRLTDTERQEELVAYHFAFRKVKDDYAKAIIDELLDRPLYINLKNKLEEPRKQINEWSDNSRAFNLIHYLKAIFQTPVFGRYFIICLLLALAFVLPPGSQRKPLDLVWELVMKLIKST